MDNTKPYESQELILYNTKMVNLRLVALSGPVSGQNYVLRDGLKIGRTRGDILLADSKVSNLHGFFVLENGRLWLQDNGSKNGIRVAGERLNRFEIKPGVKFEIGNSQFEVIGDDSVRLDEEDTPPPSVQPPHVESLDEGPKAWGDSLRQLLAQALQSGSEVTPSQELLPFVPPLKLLFVGGGQAETEWILGYGPRHVGGKSVDLPIFEPGAPDHCFKLSPSETGIVFETSNPEKVRVNQTSQTQKILSPGDVISIGDTIIEVQTIL